MSTSEKILVVVTGQLRNGADNLGNWIESAFKGDRYHFLYYIWDDIGIVDTNKLHRKCLRTRKRFGRRQTEVSSIGVYASLNRTLEIETAEIKEILGDRVTMVIEPYHSDYMTSAGDLKVNELIIQENNPSWFGSVPVSYINHLAYKYLCSKVPLTEYKQFYRVQSEAFFDTSVDYAAIFDSVKSNELLTSPDTISPSYQVSIKFFGGEFEVFSHFIDAYTPLIESYNNYHAGIPVKERPIGERFLKQLAIKGKWDVRYDIPMSLKREQVIPIKPAWKNSKEIDNTWRKPSLIEADREAFRKLSV